MSNPRFVYIETYGCSANQNNSEIMKGLLVQAGLQLTNNPKIADIIILNTCIVKEPTEKKIERRILELQKLKKKIIIAGCMPDVRAKELSNKNLFLLSNHQIKNIVKLIRKITESSYKEKEFLLENKEVKLCAPKIPLIKQIGITQLSEGCLGSCNYCLTRFAKGKLFSYQEEDIIKNIQNDISSGCKEIWLTSQDNASYGLDRDKAKLPELLRKILELKGNFKIRLGMMNPNNVLPILDDLIEIYKDERVYKFLHIPIQSGSNKILGEMNRFYNREDFLKIISKFKKELPNLTILTDMIVAYPGETEKDFQDTLNLIKEIKPEFLNTSKFWPMKGAKAAALVQVPKELAKKRAQELIELHKEISKELNKKEIGKEFKVLINSHHGFSYEARTDNYKLVKIYSREILKGFVKVKIVDQEGYSLVGKII